MRLLLVAIVLLGACAETPRNIGGASPSAARTSAAPTAAATSAAPTTPAPRTTAPLATATPPPGGGPPGPSSPSPTATRGASPSPSRTPSSSAALPSQPPQPTLAPGTTVLYSGERRFALGAGERRVFDPVELAREDGRTAPPCANLAWTSAWHATEPLRGAWIFDGTRNELGLGRWGTSSLGRCSTLELRNEGASTVDARIVFTIGSR